MEIGNLVSEGSEILESEFRIKPEQSTYRSYPAEEWENFLVQTKSNKGSLGVYLPRSLCAHLKEDSEFLSVNLFHEFFGHGLFCEHSATGQHIVTLEQKLADIERQILGLEQLPDFHHFTIDGTDPYFEGYRQQREELVQFFNQNAHNYEGFAMWLEHHLAGLTGNLDLFSKKMDEIVHPDYRKLFEQFRSFEEEYGMFALVYQLGFPKFYDKDIVIGILRRTYKEKFGSIQLCVLYGSRKPYSDIDLFIVSHEIESTQGRWLDIYAKTREEFEHSLEMLDISVTDPVFSGEVIIGSHSALKALQEKILDMPITQEAISYNSERSEEQRRNALTYPENSRGRRIALSYEKSFKDNAEALKKGNKMLTLR